MKKIKFMLDYQSMPIWLYNARGEMIGPGIPTELSDNKEFVAMINEIQTEYDNLFKNDDVYFGYHGFENKIDGQMFFAKLQKAVNVLEKYLKDQYEIIVDIDEKDFQ
jgi:hypothetical protein